MRFVGDITGFIPDVTTSTSCVSRKMRRPYTHSAYGLSTLIELLFFIALIASASFSQVSFSYVIVLIYNCIGAERENVR
jgi:hypothetical protein